jgi:hypothetical protein
LIHALGPKKQLRIMPWTGYIDAQRRRVYLWDIVQAEGKNTVVTRWRNKLGSGYSPFGTNVRTDWLGQALVIGDSYTTPERPTVRLG